MQIAILTFDGYNELDSFIAAGILNRLRGQGWQAHITTPSAEVTSMNGVTLRGQRPLEFAREADAVLVGSGMQTREVVRDAPLLDRLRLDPARQRIAAQCSGTLVLAKLGLLQGVPACTDLITKPWVEEAGVAVVNQPFIAHGAIATAGGCLASTYLAAWLMLELGDEAAARSALHYVAPVGEKDGFVAHALAVVRRGMAGQAATAAAAIDPA